jgi:hypothetical protein
MSNYKKNSPYFNTPIVNGYLDTLNYRNIPAQSDDILFTVTKNYEHRPDLLAHDIYGDVGLWWVFVVRNSAVMSDPVFDMVSGVQIYLPKITTINKALGL